LRPRSFVTTAAVAALAFVLTGCRPVDETRSLNFDAETSSGALSSGWSGFEKTGENDSFVWAQARAATVTVSSRAKGDQLLRFRCWPFRFQGAPAQTVTIFVNGSRVDSVALADGARVYSFATPEALWKAGPNEVRFEFAYAEAPKDRVPGSSDQRTLSVAFDWLELVPSRPEKKG
jgi:hypothetical protein